MNDIITEIKPHTIRKFEIIDNYVNEWARKILGYKESNGVVFIDCMSNSGRYKDKNGNLIDGTALRVARRLNDIMGQEQYIGKRAYLYFNDMDTQRITYLKSLINDENLTNITVRFSNSLEDEFLKEFPLWKYKQYNILLIYDPYQAMIDWDGLCPFLSTWGEVIINHMVSDTVRGAAVASRKQTIKKYENTYQIPINELVEISRDKNELEKIVEDILRYSTNREKAFIATFPVFNRSNNIVYNLIHFCTNIYGHTTFKKTTWKTFGNKSSDKKSNVLDGQLEFNMAGNDMNVCTHTDAECYTIRDIAKYIFIKYGDQGEVYLNVIKEDLKVHPIFPYEGFINLIKNELRDLYNASFTREKIIFKNS